MNIFLNSSYENHKTEEDYSQKQGSGGFKNSYHVDLVNCAEL